MARPEKPITWDGPVADLARELRNRRELAGPPAPTYTQLAARGPFSRSVLADAARGYRCPSWKVVTHFVTACGGNPEEEPWPTLWKLAAAAAGRGDASRSESQGSSKEPPRRRQAGVADPRKGPTPPDPWLAQSVQQYRYQLALLRAWAGLSLPEIRRISTDLGWPRYGIPYTTLHDALNPKLSRMPALPIVRLVVTACEADLEQWVGAWRAINIKEFKDANPPPADLQT